MGRTHGVDKALRLPQNVTTRAIECLERLRAILIDNLLELRFDEIKRFVPRDSLPSIGIAAL